MATDIKATPTTELTLFHSIRLAHSFSSRLTLTPTFCLPPPKVSERSGGWVEEDEHTSHYETNLIPLNL